MIFFIRYVAKTDRGANSVIEQAVFTVCNIVQGRIRALHPFVYNFTTKLAFSLYFILIATV